MWEALREATDEEMERDATVCLIGGYNLGLVSHQGEEMGGASGRVGASVHWRTQS